MQKLKIILIALVLFSVSCEKDDQVDNTFSFGEKTSFKVGETYFSNSENLQLNLEVISDSRCPIGLICIWQGEVSIEIIVRQNRKSETLKISSEDSNPVIWDSYSFVMHTVLPYPEMHKTNNSEGYSAELTVSKIKKNRKII